MGGQRRESSHVVHKRRLCFLEPLEKQGEGGCCERGARAPARADPLTCHAGPLTACFRPRSRGQPLCLHLEGLLLKQEGRWGAGSPTLPRPGPLVTEPGRWTFPEARHHLRWSHLQGHTKRPALGTAGLGASSRGVILSFTLQDAANLPGTVSPANCSDMCLTE